MPDQPAPSQTDALPGDGDELELLGRDYRASLAAGSDAKAGRERQKLAGKLDAYYWKRVDAIVQEACLRGGEGLSFTDDERLLLDVGLLDETLVDGADAELRETLLTELNTPGAPNHFYFSEWLDDRYRRFQVSLQINTPATAEVSDEVGKLTAARQKLAGVLKPLLHGLPGVNEQMQEHIIAGRLDDQIQVMGLSLMGTRDRQPMLARHRLMALRRQIFAKMQPRLAGDVRKLPEVLNTLYGKLWRERLKQSQRRDHEVSLNESAQFLLNPEDERAMEYLTGEARFAKTLLPLGALAGGVARCCSVLFENSTRITKTLLRDELACIRQADREFTVEPVVVIAPYRGRGFFEFDRDSLFVPLTPVDGASDAIAHAAGNYRMLIDSFQHDAELKTAYEAAFPGAKMARDFQQDYRTWIATAGHGWQDGMVPERFAFFRERIGPDTSGTLAPANLRYMTDQARQMLRARLEKLIDAKTADANIHYRLGVLLWQDGDAEKALAQFLHAITLDKANGMAVFSAALLLLRKGDAAQAGKLFALCRTVAAGQIWALYAELAERGDIA